jgi:hypothetical protein
MSPIAGRIVLGPSGYCPGAGRQKTRHRSAASDLPSRSDSTPRLRTMSAFASTVSLWTRAHDATLSPATRQSSSGTSWSECRNCDVMGAATKSSSPVSSNTTAGRTFAPLVWWNCIRIRTISPNRRIIHQLLVDSVLWSVGGFKPFATRFAKRQVGIRVFPHDHNSQLFTRRNLARDLGWERNLTAWSHRAFEFNCFHLASYTVSIMSQRSRPRRSSILRASSRGPLSTPSPARPTPACRRAARRPRTA